MSELLLINPRPARKKRVSATCRTAGKSLKSCDKTTKRGGKVARRRTAAQKRATAKLVAFNRARRRGNPARRTVKARRRSNPVAMYTPNPVRRRRRRNMAHTPVRRVVRRRTNPRTMRGVMNTQVMPAFQAAMGAIGLDVLWGFMPVPVDWKTGQFRHLVKGGGALMLGMMGRGILGAKLTDNMVHGALTVSMHDAAKELIAVNFPQVQLGYYSPGYPAGNMGAYIGGEGTSPYLSPSNLSTPFAGPSAASVARNSCPSLENENNMGHYY